MSRPVFLKLGGSVLTEKDKASTFRRPVAKRLFTEIRKAGAPLVLFHGAGSFGHPQAIQWKIGTHPVTPERRAGVSAVLASVAKLHAEILAVAEASGLKPISIPIHLDVESSGGILEDLPVRRIKALMKDGFTPVLHGTLVRDDELGWRVVSADELMAELADDLEPCLTLFVTDVDGVMDGDKLMETVESVESVVSSGREDATGTMRGKVQHGLTIADACPVLIVNGMERGRVNDALRGKPVVGTRLGVA